MRFDRTLLALFALLIGFVLVAEQAEAQRRRARRRRPPPPTEQVETPPEPEGEPETGTSTPAQAVEGRPPSSPFDDSAPGAAQGDAPAEAAADEEPAAEPGFDPGPVGPDVAPIRADYLALVDDLVQARARVSALGAELFRTRIRVVLQDRTGGRQSMARMVVHLDGAPVFQSDGPVEGASDEREIFTGALAPGPHVLTLEVDQRSRENDAFRYSLRESFRFEVRRERLSEVTLILEDESDMGQSFPSGGEGRYEVRTRFRVATRALSAR